MSKKSQVEAEEIDESLGIPSSSVPTTPTDLQDDIDIQKIESILKNEEVTGGMVRLERKGAIDQTFQYIIKIPIDQFDYENIKRVYGGGDYRAQTFRANGQLYKKFTFSIDYRFKGMMDEQQIRDAAAQAAQQNIKTSGPTMSDLLAVMKAAQPIPPKPEDNSVFLKIMESNQNQAQQNMMLIVSMMQESNKMMMQSMATMVGAMGNANRPPSMDAAIIPIVTEMIKTKSQTQTPITETLAMIRELKDIVGEGHGPAAAEETILDKVLKYGSPVLAAYMNRGAGPMPMPMPPMQPMPELPAGPTPEPSNVVSMNQPTPAQAVNLNPATMWVIQAISASERGSDPSLYADLLLDGLTADQVVELRGILTKDNWRVLLFGQNPEVLSKVEQKAEWFEELHQLLLEEPADEQPTGDVRPVNTGAGIAEPIRTVAENSTLPTK